MLDSSHLGDRPVLLWSMAFGMLALAFILSLTGLGAKEELETAFFRLPFIVGLFLATFVMGFVRPELLRTWTIGMGGVPAVVLIAFAQVRIIFTPEHSAGDLWPVGVLLALILGLSIAFAGSSLGARTSLRLSRG